jgi:hypothetical protein
VKFPGFLLAIGSLLLLVGSFGSVYGLIQSVAAPTVSWDTPGSQVLELGTGRWVVYEQAPTSQATPRTPIRRISVYGPAGEVPLDCLYCNNMHYSMTRGTQSYVGVAGFDVKTAGQYRVTVTEPHQTIMVAPGIFQGILAFTGGLLVAIAGGVVVFISLVWLVIGAITPRRGL